MNATKMGGRPTLSMQVCKFQGSGLGACPDYLSFGG